MFVRVRALIVKEMLAILRDKRSRIVLVVPPVLMLTLFSFAATLEVKNVSIAILNLDQGFYGRELTERFTGSPTFTRVLALRGEQEIRPLVDSQEVLLALSIPQDFSRTIAAGSTATVQVILDGRRSNAAQIVLGYVMRMVDTFNREIMASSGGQVQGGTLVVRHWFNPNLDFIWYTVPSLLAILCLVMGLVVTALSVSRERELGTFDQLLVSPLRPIEILFGKTLPAMIIGMADGTLLLIVAIFAFRVPFTGSLGLLYLSMTAFLASVIGVGLFISSISKTQQQAMLGSFVFMVPATLLSGFATPVENIPSWLRPFSDYNPLTYFLIVIKGIFLKDMDTALVLDNVWPMLVIAVATLAGAGFFFKRKIE